MSVRSSLSQAPKIQPTASSRPERGLPDTEVRETVGFSYQAGNSPAGDGARLRRFEEDRSLMTRVRRGDRGAFEQLVDLHWNHVLMYAQSLTHDPDPALDLTQEAFVRLWNRREQWVDTGSARMWLLRTVRNLIISEQRKWKVRKRWTERVSSEGIPGPRTPLQEVESGELRTAINDAVAKLPPRRREAFTLYHLQGLSYREVGEIMEIKEQTVANYLQAALADLRVSLASFLPLFAAGPGRSNMSGDRPE